MRCGSETVSSHCASAVSGSGSGALRALACARGVYCHGKFVGHASLSVRSQYARQTSPRLLLLRVIRSLASLHNGGLVYSPVIHVW